MGLLVVMAFCWGAFRSTIATQNGARINYSTHQYSVHPPVRTPTPTTVQLITRAHQPVPELVQCQPSFSFTLQGTRS